MSKRSLHSHGFASKRIDQVGKFWVVVMPRPISTLIDILFESDVEGMTLQYRGGLSPHDVVGFYRNKKTAEKKAKALLKAVHDE